MSDAMKQAIAARVEDLPTAAGPIAVDAVPMDILEGVRDALLSGETHYTDRPGMRELREKVAATLGRAAEEIVITTGDREARFVTRLAFGETPKDVDIRFHEESKVFAARGECVFQVFADAIRVSLRA